MCSSLPGQEATAHDETVARAPILLVGSSCVDAQRSPSRSQVKDRVNKTRPRPQRTDLHHASHLALACRHRISFDVPFAADTSPHPGRRPTDRYCPRFIASRTLAIDQVHQSSGGRRETSGQPDVNVPIGWLYQSHSHLAANQLGQRRKMKATKVTMSACCKRAYFGKHADFSIVIMHRLVYCYADYSVDCRHLFFL